jgi:hypothetical protein
MHTSGLLKHLTRASINSFAGVLSRIDSRKMVRMIHVYTLKQTNKNKHAHTWQAIELVSKWSTSATSETRKLVDSFTLPAQLPEIAKLAAKEK